MPHYSGALEVQDQDARSGEILEIERGLDLLFCSGLESTHKAGVLTALSSSRSPISQHCYNTTRPQLEFRREDSQTIAPHTLPILLPHNLCGSVIHALMLLSTLLLLFPDHFSCCGKGKFTYQTKSLRPELYTNDENCVGGGG